MTATDADAAAASQPAASGSAGGAVLPRGRLVGVALVSASVLLLQLVQTRIFSVMLWHHLTYLVVTFTLLGFAAGGAVLACRPAWLSGDTSSRGALWSILFGLSTLASYVLITRFMPDTSHSRSGIAGAAVQYGVLVLPMVFGGLVVALSLSDARGAVGRVYAWNMVGSALGCAIYVPALRVLGGEGSVLFAAALACAGGLAFGRGGGEAGRGSRWGGIAALCAVGLTLLAWLAPTALFSVPVAGSKALTQVIELSAREGSPLVIEETYWDPLCRLDVVGPGPGVEPGRTRTIYQDGDAPTVLPFGPAHKTADIGSKEGLAYLLFRERPPKVLAIGIGGGIDILQAKATKREFPDGGMVDFTGVEINATTARLMRTRFKDLTADRYHLPGVSIHVDEGRSWLRRSDEQYDIIQMTGTDTYAALSSGSYVMSESYLYTLEAYDDFLGHLTDDGVISVLRFRFDPPRETLRLAAIAVEALRRDGAEDPAEHVILLGVTGGKVTLPNGRVVGLDYGTLLIGKRPFTSEEVEMYRQYADFVEGVFVMYAPGIDVEGPTRDYFDAVRAGTDDDFRARYLYNLDPVSDDSPFFFRYHRWSNVADLLFGSGDGHGGETEPAGAGANEPRESAVGEEYSGIVGGEPIGLIMLVTVLLESAALVALLVVIPLLLFRREGLKTPGSTRWLLYFFGLGAGYILVEIAAMQRFVLFLGHPGYAITVVLITFLVFSGLGSAVAGRSHDPRRTLKRALVGVLLLIGLVAFGLPIFFDAALKLALPVRIGLTVLVLGPVAFVMGMPFPSGLALLSAEAKPMVPWAFGVNGGASVIASVAGILVAMAQGFSMAFGVAAGAYLLALLAGARGAPGGAGAPGTAGSA